MTDASIVDVPVIDAHHHLTRLELGYPWLALNAPTERYHGDDRQLRADYTVEQYRSDVRRLPLVASVHVENGAADGLQEAEWIGEVIAAYSPTPLAQVASADLSVPDAVGLLERYANMVHVRGIRHILNWHADPRVSHTSRPSIIDERPWRDAFGRLAQLDLSFDLQVFAAQLPDAARLARDHPDTRIILDHAGMPLTRDPEHLSDWRRGMRELAACSNVAVKISAIGTTDHRWSVESIAPIVEDTIQTFGPRRVMFASNFPVDGMYSTLEELYAAFAALTADYTRDERAEMFGRTAAREYRLEKPGA